MLGDQALIEINAAAAQGVGVGVLRVLGAAWSPRLTEQDHRPQPQAVPAAWKLSAKLVQDKRILKKLKEDSPLVHGCSSH